MALAAGNLTRVALELGGKAPAIMWRDADLDVAVPAIVAARHTNAGQVCTAAERVFVHDDLYEPFLEAYVAAVAELIIGHPSGEVDLGPLASAQQLAKTELAVGSPSGRGPRSSPAARPRLTRPWGWVTGTRRPCCAASARR